MRGDCLPPDRADLRSLRASLDPSAGYHDETVTRNFTLPIGSPSPAMTARSFAIVPAAGRSRRMGVPKLLLPWAEGTIIEAALAAWKAANVHHRIVVVHPADAGLAHVVRQAGGEVCLAPQPPPDMKASVRLGLEYAAQHWQAGEGDVWLLAPADIPAFSPQLVQTLLAAHAEHPELILVPMHAGHRGHPVLFPWRYAAEVARLPADAGVNRLLETFPVREIPSALPAAEDIDTPEAYQRLRP
jgi:molybdenum cofactor cytidylyltransferase